MLPLNALSYLRTKVIMPAQRKLEKGRERSNNRALDIRNWRYLSLAIGLFMSIMSAFSNAKSISLYRKC